MPLHLLRNKCEKNCASIFNAIAELVPLTISFHLYFLRISKVLSVLHHRSVGQVQSKKMLLYVYLYFCGVFLLSFIKKFVFIIFISFSDEVPNFRNKILINQSETGTADKELTVKLYA